MRILHTSDWHVGRTFHGHQTLDHLEAVLIALATLVAAKRVDVVVIAGDVFDSAIPNGAAMALLGRVLQQIIAGGAQVVLTAGNHDSATRLGYLANFTAASGLHIFTDPNRIGHPIPIADPGGGEVLFFGVPFLDPVMIRHLAPQVRSQSDAMQWAMGQISAATPPGARSVVTAHTFVVSNGIDADVAAEAKSAPRDFTRGGVDNVSATVFTGPTYVALGHLHGRSKIANQIRYSGAPLCYSFGEIGRKRGVWIVDIDVGGNVVADWADLPIPRPLRQLTGELRKLLEAQEYQDAETCWVKAILTDNTRPVDAMRLLQQRFPYCAEIEYRPAQTLNLGIGSYTERIKSLSDAQITADFLAHVRNGEGPTAAEIELIAELMGSGS